jgi:hypothetical protein
MLWLLGSPSTLINASLGYMIPKPTRRCEENLLIITVWKLGEDVLNRCPEIVEAMRERRRVWIAFFIPFNTYPASLVHNGVAIDYWI